MGSKNKLRRFRDNEQFTNLIQPSREEIQKGNFRLRGKWGRDFFKNKMPIVLELGCGKGEYALGLSKLYPNKNFLGIDIKGARLWRGAKTALEQNNNRVKFMRTQIELIDLIFAESEIDEIWLTFSDPQIKYKRTKHRLINSEYLRKYKKILKPGGVVHLKTDSEFLHGYALGLLHGEGHEILEANHDVYKNDYSPEEVVGIQTFYEKQFLEKDKRITYIKFRII